MKDLPYTDDSGHVIVDKSPIHTQVVITEGGTTWYIPVKSFTWSKSTDLVANKHSGSPLSSSLLDGHHDYKFSFKTGSWVTAGVAQENAEAWEYLTYTHLTRPFDAGRPKIFTIAHMTSSYYDDGATHVNDGDVGTLRGGQTIMFLSGCKINNMTMDQGESGVITRTYEGLALRLTYGSESLMEHHG